MAKWKLFGKSKTEKDETLQPQEPITQEQEDQSIVNYKETLYATNPKKGSTKTSSNDKTWRDVDAIEKKVDNLHITRAGKPVTDLDKTVERLIDKRKRK